MWSAASASCEKDWQRCEAIFNVERRREQLQQLEAAAGAPGFWDDADKARHVIGQTNAQRAFVKPHDALAQLLEDAGVMLDMAAEEPAGAQRDAAMADVVGMLDEAEDVARGLRLQSLLNGPMDACNAFLTLHAGAGGTESCDWAEMLFRMYRRYCENHGFELETLDYQPGEEAGLKSVTFNVRGAYAYGYLKGERGVHRLVRISPFDSNKRRHTSFCALDVVAELEQQRSAHYGPSNTAELYEDEKKLALVRAEPNIRSLPSQFMLESIRRRYPSFLSRMMISITAMFMENQLSMSRTASRTARSRSTFFPKGAATMPQ